MTDINLQDQINDMNRKLDMVLDEVNAQRLNRQVQLDLLDDVSIIGTDIFKTAVTELDAAAVDFDGEGLIRLGLKMIKNIENFNDMIDLFESMVDLGKDLGPIVKQVGIDGIHELEDLEQKGYIDFIKDMKTVADSAVMTYNAMDTQDIPNVSMFGMIKELNKPHMKKTLGFMFTFLKNMNEQLDANFKKQDQE